MKPTAFDYLAPGTVDEAVDALAAGAQVLAGGQSLLLEMHLQRVHPNLVADINHIPGLDALTVADGTLTVGALVRHQTFESPGAVPGPLGDLFGRAVVNIAHPPIRARGTMAGSLAWAHPASEWCALAVALDAVVELRSTRGTREIPAGDYFLGPFRTAREPDELLTAVRYPLLAPDTGVAFTEHRRTGFSFAQVAVGAALTIRDGVITEARIGLANCADRPLRAHAAERALVGAGPSSPVFARAGETAAEQDAAPVPEPYADVDYRRHVIAVLVARTLREAAPV
ncbi:xanthine dehydrogenase family protein subunit M [Herbidospora sp. NBRC 101105]|uniref:FAD binding domain-containing protein n=1 Tax=Herbidospora sp. NBRC 101105 TaxID=3032195 RepID=UPI0024A2D6CB|nr:xanthine dehydrogenase family protein subunit M [Herbidospora sp. NBRC 101105]GLX93486.1 carbon-monoxide dehydrogenase medium subunit [Herbidospora sp. NBRC 101105]